MEVARREEEESTSVLGEEGEGEEDDDDDDLLGVPGASGDGGGVVSQIDLGRTLRFTLVGAAFLAPALHTWYGFLIRTLPGTALTTVVKRVALDQLVFTPVFLAGFLSTLMVSCRASEAPKLPRSMALWSKVVIYPLCASPVPQSYGMLSRNRSRSYHR